MAWLCAFTPITAVTSKGITQITLSTVTDAQSSMDECFQLDICIGTDLAYLLF